MGSRRAAVVSLACVLGAAMAAATPASGAERALLIDVSQPRLAAALAELGQETGAEVLFDPALVRGLPARPLRGRLSVGAALSALLSDSGLGFRRTAEGVFVVVRLPPAAAAPAEGAVAEILVTGRRTQNADIRRAENDIQGYKIATQRDLQLAHRDTLDDYLRSREPADAALRSPQQDTLNRPGYTRSEIDLRGLGPRRTVVLVDGRRMPRPPSGTEDFDQSDVNALPLGAIERVETLTSTAGGIYGPGAVGGAVNIVLRRDYRGADLQVTGGLSDRGDAQHWRVEARAGATSADGDTQAMLFAAYSGSRPLLAGARDFGVRARRQMFANDPAAFIAMQPTGNAISVFSAGGPLTLDPALGGTALGAAYTFLPTGFVGSQSDRIAALVANAGRLALDLPSDRSGSGAYLMATPETYSGLVNVRRRLGRRLEVFVDGVYLANRGRLIGGSPPVMANVAADAPSNPFAQPVIFQFPTPVFRTAVRVRDDAVRLNVGAIYDLAPDWKLSLEQTVGGAWFSASVGSVVASGAFAPALASGVAPPTGQPALAPLGDWDGLLSALAHYTASQGFRAPLKTRFSDTTLRLAGVGPRLPGGDLTLTVLGERRVERVPVAELNAGGLAVLQLPARREAVNSAYAELRAPLASSDANLFLVRGAEAQMAMRYDGVDMQAPLLAPIGTVDPPLANVHYDAVTYTLGGKVLPLPRLLLRASLATGELPPTLNDLQSRSAQFSGDVFRTPDARRGGRPVGTEGAFTVLFGGSLAIQPARATTVSVGVVINPEARGGPRVSVDYSRIDERREVVSFESGPSALLADETNQQDRVVRAPLTAEDQRLGFTAGRVLSFDLRALDSGRTVAEALDARLDWLVPGGEAGDFRLYLRGTRQLQLKRRGADNEPWRRYEGAADGPLTWRANGGVEWTRGPFTADLNLQLLAGYRRLPAGPVGAEGEQVIRYQGSDRVPGQAYLDLAVSRRFEGPATGGLLRSFEARFGVQNLLDASPPVLAQFVGPNYAAYGDPRGRRLELALLASF